MRDLLAAVAAASIEGVGAAAAGGLSLSAQEVVILLSSDCQLLSYRLSRSLYDLVLLH